MVVKIAVAFSVSLISKGCLSVYYIIRPLSNLLCWSTPLSVRQSTGVTKTITTPFQCTEIKGLKVFYCQWIRDGCCWQIEWRILPLLFRKIVLKSFAAVARFCCARRQAKVLKHWQEAGLEVVGSPYAEWGGNVISSHWLVVWNEDFKLRDKLSPYTPFSFKDR